jgi:ATP-binding cassette subfamily F protein uup
VDGLRLGPAPAAAAAPVRPAAPRAERAAASARRLGYMEKRELAALPARIEQLETEKHEVYALMASPTFYARGGVEIAAAQARLAALDAELHAAYARWGELDAVEPGG